MVSKRAEELEGLARSAVLTLEHLLAPGPVRGRTLLAELLRRAEQPMEADGFRGSALPVAGVTGFGSSTSVEVAVVQREEDRCERCDEGIIERSDGTRVNCRACNGTGRRRPDPVADAVRDIVRHLRVCEQAAGVIHAKTNVVMDAADRVFVRGSLAGNCAVAGCARFVSGNGEDRLRMGYCRRCYLRWTSWRLVNKTADPGHDRMTFQAWMTEWLRDEAHKEEEHRLRKRHTYNPATDRRKAPAGR
jgi:hypothetical protein